MSGGTLAPPPPPGPVKDHELTFVDFGWIFAAGMAVWAALEAFRLLFETILSGYQTAEAEFQNAIDSTDLKILSRYLRHKLGSLTVHDYVGKSLPRERVDLYISKLTAFVGSDFSQVSAAEEDALQPVDVSDNVSDTVASKTDEVPWLYSIYSDKDDPAIMQEAKVLIENGAIWTALATLRRDLEVRLRDVLGGRAPQPSDVANLYGPEIGKKFERFRRVANRAIHGEEVRLESARAAVNAARAVYEAVSAGSAQLPENS